MANTENVYHDKFETTEELKVGYEIKVFDRYIV